MSGDHRPGIHEAGIQKDLVQMEIEKAKKLSQLKEEAGENFTYEPIADM